MSKKLVNILSVITFCMVSSAYAELPTKAELITKIEANIKATSEALEKAVAEEAKFNKLLAEVEQKEKDALKLFEKLKDDDASVSKVIEAQNKLKEARQAKSEILETFEDIKASREEAATDAKEAKEALSDNCQNGTWVCPNIQYSGNYNTSNEAVVIVVLGNAKVFRISRPAEHIIIGNQEILNYELLDKQTLVLRGNVIGKTNIIILDKQGDAIIDQAAIIANSNVSLKNTSPYNIAKGKCIDSGGSPKRVRKNNSHLDLNVADLEILNFNAEPKSAIIGDPNILDVNIEHGKTAVIAAKNNGSSGVVILNEDGDVLLDTVVNVMQERVSVPFICE